VPGAFHGEVPGPVWPDEDSHSPWIDCQGPRHRHAVRISGKRAAADTSATLLTAPRSWNLAVRTDLAAISAGS
jgi:hypothetical protein